MRDNREPIHLGQRQYKLYDTEVIFDSTSTIKFYRDDKLILQLDPTELSAVYGSYMQMRKEENYEKK